MTATSDTSEVPQEVIQVVLFTLAGEDMAFIIQEVREIIKVPVITKVPDAPDFVEGVINLRGQIKTVVNLKKQMGLEAEDSGEDARIIIVEGEGQDYGVIVDSVVGVHTIPVEEITDPSAVLGGDKSEFIKGIGKLGGRLLMLLEPTKIITLAEVANNDDTVDDRP